MLTTQSNAGRMFAQTVTEFSRSKWSGRDVVVGLPAGVNKPVLPTDGLRNIQVHLRL